MTDEERKRIERNVQEIKRNWYSEDNPFIQYYTIMLDSKNGRIYKMKMDFDEDKLNMQTFRHDQVFRFMTL